LVSLTNKTEDLPMGVKHAQALQEMVYRYMETKGNVEVQRKFKATGAIIIFFNGPCETHLVSVGLISYGIAILHLIEQANMTQ